VRAYYEDVWGDLPDDPRPWAWDWRRELLGDEVRPGDRALDLGCGSGRFLTVLQAAGAEPIGVDISARALERARRMAPGADTRLLEADGSLPIDHGSIDLVWCSEVIEHVADVGLLLGEVRRVLAPGGRLLLTTPSHGRLRRVLLAATRFDAHFDPLGQHLRFFSAASLRRALGFSRLEVTRVVATGGLPLLRETLVARALRPAPQSPGAASARVASSTSEADRGA